MKTRTLFSLVLSTLIGLSVPSRAMYIRAETLQVPVKRLIDNLTEKAKAEPENPETYHLLARAHAVAFSKKLSDADTMASVSSPKMNGAEQPFFEPGSPHVPFNKTTATADAEKLATAKAHLKAAIENYKKALALKPGDITMMLGLAWCQDQAGEKEDAIAGYRKVAEAAWLNENKRFGGLGDFVFVETAGYLIPLLDQTKDAKEIAQLNERKEKLLALPRAVTPIIVPLDGANTGIQSLVDADASVRFDLDGTGRQLQWPWIQKNAAWLVFDPQNTGKITSAIQMFGNRTFLLFCKNGYQALSLLDDNADEVISGTELQGLALWQDLNGNGVSEPGEVKPVSAYGIKKLSTTHATHPSGMPYCLEGVTFESGETRPTYDLILESK